MKKVAVLVGSISEASINRKLARLLMAEVSDEVVFEMIEIENWPMYSSQAQANYPKPIQKAKKTISAADGILIITPEYNRSISGLLKNALDWLSRPGGGENPFRGRRVAITGVSPGKIGTALAQRHLREIMVYLGADIFPREVYLTSGDIFEGDKLVDETATYLRDFLKEYLEI